MLDIMRRGQRWLTAIIVVGVAVRVLVVVRQKFGSTASETIGFRRGAGRGASSRPDRAQWQGEAGAVADASTTGAEWALRRADSMLC